MARVPHVLIVDDDSYWLDRIRTQLPTLNKIAQAAPDRLHWAETPEHAESLAKQRHFDLVIADVKFPAHNRAYVKDISELPLCRVLEASRTPVILLSNFADRPIGRLNVMALVDKNSFKEDMDAVLKLVLDHLGLSDGEQKPEEISWLHISDFHYGYQPGAAQDRRVIETAFLHDVRVRREQGHALDYIFATGDIAWSGKALQYAQAAEFFGRLLEVSGLSSSRLHVLPGNHDVDLDRVGVMPRGLAKPTERRHISDRLADDVYRNATRAHFTDYREFVDALRLETPKVRDDDMGFIVKDQGLKLVFVGLNSALGSGLARSADNKPEDRGALFVGEQRLMELLEGLDRSWFRVVMMHHPAFWLAECEVSDITRLLQTHCDLFLHGHLHVSEFQRVLGMRTELRSIACGSLFQGRDLVNSYNVTTLDLQKATLEVRYRRFSDAQRAFVKDLDSTGDELDGCFTTPMRQRP